MHAAKAKHGRCWLWMLEVTLGSFRCSLCRWGVLAIDAQPRCIHRPKSAAAVNGFTRGLDTRWAAVTNKPGEGLETHSENFKVLGAVVIHWSSGLTTQMALPVAEVGVPV